MIKKIIFIFLTVFIGVVFLYSGYAKLYPIEPFEYTFVDLGFINWQVAPFVARLMIGAEFCIGILLILHLNLKNIYRIAIGLLAIFCIYLVLLMVIVGNKGNCGCFGTKISMTPFQALIKNIVMIAMLLLLKKYHIGWELKGKLKYLFILLFVFAFAMPFILNYVELDYSQAYLNKPENNFELELDSLYKDATVNIPPKSLSEGKHVIAFMSLTCPHCRIAAKKIRIMHEKNSELSFYFVLNGEEKNLIPFFEDTHTEAIPYCILNGRNFVYLAGLEMPTIYLVNNSVVEHWVDYIDLDQSEIEKWVKNK